MPHVIVKLYAGRTEQQKQALAKALTEAVMRTLNSAEDSISVGIEDVAANEWTAKVYQPDILDKAGTIYKKPGYEPQ